MRTGQPRQRPRGPSHKVLGYMKVLVVMGQLGTDHTRADFMPGGTLATLRYRYQRAVQSRFQSLGGLCVMVKVRQMPGEEQLLTVRS